MLGSTCGDQDITITVDCETLDSAQKICPAAQSQINIKEEMCGTEELSREIKLLLLPQDYSVGIRLLCFWLDLKMRSFRE